MQNLASGDSVDRPSKGAIRFDRFALDVSRGSLASEVGEIWLRPKSFAVLRYLVENAGRLIAKDEIFTALWPNAIVTDDSLVQCISEIRQVLHDDGQRLIKTLPRRGYLFDAAITRSEGAAASAAQQTSSAAAGDGVANSDRATIMPTEEEFAHRLSIAVMPLVNVSGDPAYDHLADALTENLITDLSRIRDSMIITPNSVFSYKDKHVSVEQVARELGVRYLFTGSLQCSATRIRVNGQLIDTRRGTNLWAERFEYDGPDIWRWQDEVTRKIAGTLKFSLVELASRRGGTERPANPDAIDLTMRGVVLFSRFSSRADVIKARGLFEQALRLDPSSVQALVGFAGSHVLELAELWADDPTGQLKQADIAIARALELDPLSAEVRYTQGNLFMQHGQHEQAIAEYRAAIDLNPSFSHAYSRIGLAKLELGRPAETFDPVRKALRFSPPEYRTSLCQSYLGMASFHLSQDAEATEWFQKALTTDSRSGRPRAWLAAIHALKGRHDEAQAEIAEFSRIHPGHTIASLKAREWSNVPAFLAQRERFYQGLIEAGLPRS
jgi:TolB-like protein/cytochrome c-type biogenesis protein CcmH/NrfG